MTPVQICNLALSLLGQKPITNLLEPQTRIEELCAQWYDTTRRSLLEEGEWSFATRRLVSESPPTPANSELINWGFAYAHPTPSNCLRVLAVRDNPEDNSPNSLYWQIEDGNILTDSSSIFVRYLYDLTDSHKFTESFAHALAAKLATELCIAITDNAGLKSSLYAIYDAKRRDAINTDSLQGKSRRLRSINLTTWR